MNTLSSVSVDRRLQTALWLATSACIFVLVKADAWLLADADRLATVGLVTLGLPLAALRTHWPARSLAILGRGIALTLGLYSVAGSNGFALHPDSSSCVAWVLGAGSWLALAMAIASWWRPAFLIGPSIYVLITKRLTEVSTGVIISSTDYLPVVEIGLLIGIAAVTLGHFRFNAHGRKLSANLLLLLCVAIHFGNYFWSGIAKITLDGGPMDWALNNRTQYLLLTTWVTGHLPIAALGELPLAVYRSLELGQVASNIAILSVQLLSIVAVARRRWMIAVTLLYDISHIAIFAVTGIFFWKWILLNVFIVLALARLEIERIPAMVIAACVATVLLAHAIFFTARLGWYDTRSNVVTRIEALTGTGERIPVPSNWFLASSVTVAQQRLGWPFPGHYPTATFGTTQSSQVSTAANDCRLPAPNADRYSLDANVSRFIRNHHRMMLGRSTINYDIYPHHIWSNPWLYTSFKNLDKARIVGYDYRVLSICTDPQLIGRPTSTIYAQSSFRIPVSRGN